MAFWFDRRFVAFNSVSAFSTLFSAARYCDSPTLCGLLAVSNELCELVRTTYPARIMPSSRPLVVRGCRRRSIASLILSILVLVI